MSVRGQPKSVKTTCPYCGVGCGVIATPDASGKVAIAGDPEHPANFGQLCVKGTALGETLATDGRLSVPLINGLPSTWPRAISQAAKALQATIDKHGPDSVAFYLSGQLLTEDYYVANKLAKGFIGTPHVDTNSRLCMASSVAGHRRVFGSDTVPNCYEDLDQADLIVLVGSNAAWCHPILYRRMQAARDKRGTRIVNIDPRRTATSEGADMHLSIAPGMDSVLWSHVLVEIDRRDVKNAAYVASFTSGFDSALARALEIAPDVETAATKAGLTVAQLTEFTSLWIETERVVTCYSQGVNQSVQGTDKVTAILNCHIATGRIGKPGCGPLSLTGQPNAMGGREVGGLANMLAAHMGFSDTERGIVGQFWQASNLVTGEGLKAVQMFEAIETGRIKALWVMCTNPAVSLPRADHVRAALNKLDCLIVSESHKDVDGLLSAADFVFPAAPWGEKDGTVTNSERRISRQRRFLPTYEEAKPDWWIICEIAKAMGFNAGFDYAGPAAVFREHAALSSVENHGGRVFNIGPLSAVNDADYETLEPVQWPISKAAQGGTIRLFSEGGYPTPDGRARFAVIAAPADPQTADANELLLNTGRVRDHWHTMSRTRLSPRLNRHILQPYLEMHPEDAASHGVSIGDYVRVQSAHGRAVLKVRIDEGARRGSVFAPIHWNDLTSGHARVDALVHALTDPFSGQPDSKATPVQISRTKMRSHGVLVTRQRVELPTWLAHTRVQLGIGEAIIFASERAPAEMHALLANFLPTSGERLEFDDAGSGLFRCFIISKSILMAGHSIGTEQNEAVVEWMIDRFSSGAPVEADRHLLLAARNIAGAPGAGAIICACHGISEPVILSAIHAGATSVDAVGLACKAGTNCGSCRPDINRLLRANEGASHEAAIQPAA